MKVFGIYSAVLMALTLAACSLFVDGRMELAQRAPAGPQGGGEAMPVAPSAPAKTPRIALSR
ncbi:hypothetical protein [Solimonas sp. SE-A11]|uniref:hypothetical protein n=1 Tax=Solimonas sp. SE-A11 TaxID=3054954 RepID=UPI00259D18B2|nr:hypothetical protein [Solimonas sp. SE-A11]MDM4771900.1 hypothetical protein [Solimonas sp. SE-A11]